MTRKSAKVTKKDTAPVRGAQGVIARQDDWGNPYSGLGGPIDRRSQTKYAFAPRLSSEEIRELWRGNDIVAKVIEMPCAAAWRKGFTLNIHQDTNALEPDVELDGTTDLPEGEYEAEVSETEAPEDTDESAPPPEAKAKEKKDSAGKRWFRRAMRNDFGFGAPPPAPKPPKPLPQKDEGVEQQKKDTIAKWEDLCAKERFKKAQQYQRAYGGAAIYMGVDGNQESPLNLDAISEVKFLTVFRGGFDGEIRPVKYYSNPFLPKYNEPEIYEVRPFGAGAASGGARIHESRLLVFQGIVTDERHLQENSGWGDGNITRMFEVLRDFGAAWGGVATLVDDFATPVYKIKGLSQALAQGMFGVLQNRIKAIHMSRSSINAAVLDAENEDFGRMTTTLTGVDSILTKFESRISASTGGIPVTLLFGTSPGGMNATGKSDLEGFYNMVGDLQSDVLEPLVETLLRVIFRSKLGPTKGVEPDNWDLVWNPLWSMTAKEMEDMRLVVAQRDQIYILQQVLTPEEVARDRFGDKWSPESTIDNTAREDLQVEAEAEAEESAKQIQEMAKKMPDDPAGGDSPPKPGGKPPGKGKPFGG